MAASDDLMLLPGAEGFETWKAKGQGDVMPEPGVKTRRAAWVGLPAKSLVSFPVRFHGGDAERREAAVKLEMETLGLGGEEIGAHLFETRAADDATRDQKGWAVMQTAVLPQDVLDAGLDARFAPSVCFQSLEPGRARVWREAGGLTLALPDEDGRPLHTQALTSQEPDADAAAEIRCILAAAELAGAAPEIAGVTVNVDAQDEGATLVKSDFAPALDVPVEIGEAQKPKAPRETWRLVPEPVLKKRVARQQRQTMMLIGSAAVLAILAGLGAFGFGLWKRGQDQSRELALLAQKEPQLQQIRDSRDLWISLQTALTPDQYPVELFYQIVNLLPPEGIRLTLFELSEDKLILAGEASSIQHANNFREELSSKPAFKEWGFADGFPAPEVLPDNRAQFHAEGTRPAFAATP